MIDWLVSYVVQHKQATCYIPARRSTSVNLAGTSSLGAQSACHEMLARRAGVQRSPAICSVGHSGSGAVLYWPAYCWVRFACMRRSIRTNKNYHGGTELDDTARQCYEIWTEARIFGISANTSQRCGARIRTYPLDSTVKTPVLLAIQ